MGSDRPGGLTALGIINLVYGVISVLGAFGSIAIMAAFLGAADGPQGFQNPGPGPGPGRGFRGPQMDALRDVGLTPFVISSLASCAYGVLLIVSGIGYLKLKKFLGRVLGNVGALVGIAATAVTGVLLPVTLGGGFGLGAIIGLVYPVVTLLMLNLTFKEDLVR